MPNKNPVWHPYTRQSAVDSGTLPVIESADGLYLTDTSGTRYLDAISSWWACNLGHSHPQLQKAITEQTAKLQHCILGNQTHPAAEALAQRLSDLFPDERVTHFASDGASAIEAAMKIAIQYHHNLGRPQKHRLASLSLAYHGDTLATLSLGFLDGFHTPFEHVRFPFLQADAPCMNDCGGEACNLTCFESMRSLIEQHADELAAVVFEPLCQGAGGMRIYSADYLKELSRLCKQHDILLIADEIAVGYGRTGKMFACDHADLVPDITCLGKGLSGGYLPISAAVTKREIYETFTDLPEDHTFYHGHTFAGNPIASALALAVLDVYEADGIVERARVRGEQLATQMHAFEAIPGVERVRTLGMIARYEAKSINAAQQIQEAMMQEQILVRPLGRALYLMLPLIIDPETMETCTSLLRKATESAH